MNFCEDFALLTSNSTTNLAAASPEAAYTPTPIASENSSQAIASAPSNRYAYMDHLRTVGTAQVVLAHIAMVYGGTGFWFYREIGNSRSPVSVLFTMFVITTQAYLMGFFFLLAGFFTPASYDRKGPVKFLTERFLRLGLPIALFACVIAPLCFGMVSAADGQGFWTAVNAMWQRQEFVNGPLWFTQGLLIFSVGYTLWRQLPFNKRENEHINKLWTKLPGHRAWLLFLLAAIAVTFAVRLVFPADARFAGVWIGNFTNYIFLFCLGIAAHRHQWINQLNLRQARLWIIVSVLAWPVIPIVKSTLRTTDTIRYLLGGMHWQALVYAAWDPLVAAGIMCALLLAFRKYWNKPSPFTVWLDRRAYAVFVFHAPVTVVVCLLLRGWHAPSLIKFGVAGFLSCALSWLLADPLVRLPIVRKIF